MATDYEEKYLLLRDENTALKKKKNEQEATIKRMFTKLAMIEEALKKKRQAEENDNQQDPDTGGKAATTIPVKRDLDTERFVNALKHENLVLRKKTQALAERNRVLEEKLRQVQRKPQSALVRPASGHTGGAISKKTQAPPQTHTTKPLGFAGATLDAQVGSARKQQRDAFSSDLEQALKSRLVVAEKHVVTLQRENERLRSSKQRRGGTTSNNNSNNAQSDDEDDDDAGPLSRPRGTASTEIEHLKRELRDRQAQLAILTARYDNAEATAAAEREIQEQTLAQLDAMNRQVHKLRTQLQDAAMDRERLETRDALATDLEHELARVREQSRRLEDRMTSLCESPFIHDAFERKERIDRLFALEAQSAQQQQALAHVTGEHEKLQAIHRELQSTVKALKLAKDAAEHDAARVRQHLADEREARSAAVVRTATAQPAVREPVPPAGVTITIPAPEPSKRDAGSSPVRLHSSPVVAAQLQPHTSSHVVVSRRYDPLTLDAPVSPLGDAPDSSSAKHLRHRVHVLQLAHLRAMQELERCEQMLHAQTNINRELAREVEDLTARKLSASSALQRKIQELALVADERQTRVQALEAQVRQLKYARAKLRQTAQFFDAEPVDDSDDDGSDDASDTESVSESLVLAARDLAPGEQLLELCVLRGAFDRNAVASSASTFVLADFYDFESQTTPLIAGSRPEYSFAATFCVTVDGFFLRYLASDALVLEVHQAVRGDFQLVGRARIRLAALLRSRGVLREHALPVHAVLTSSDSSKSVIGTLDVVLRLSCPVSEIWRLHLRSYPQDIQLLERPATAVRAGDDNVEDDTAASGDTDTTADDSEAQHRVNELQITIFGCRGLRSVGAAKKTGSLSRIPSAYAHYQLLGFPDAFTNIVAESAAPEFDVASSRQTYVLEVDACLLRFLTKFRLWITVFDDQIELDASRSSDDGMIGRCALALADLADCRPVRGWFALRDRSDAPAGEVSVLLQWKLPFDVPTVLGYEVVDIEAQCARVLSEETTPSESARVLSDAKPKAASADEPRVAPTPALPAAPLDLDVDVLVDSKLPSQPMTVSAAHKPAVSRATAPPPLNALASDMSAASAASEFARRKQLFLDRMKAIASASSKSLVYEALAHKQTQQRLEAEAVAEPARSSQAPLDLLAQLHATAPQPIHHSAAATVQHSFRRYRAVRAAQQLSSIVSADEQLQRLFAKWSVPELAALETQLVARVEAAAADRARTVSRKQMAFVLAQTPQVAIDAALLQQLMAHFAVTQRRQRVDDDAAPVAYRALIRFICSVATPARVRAQQQQHAAVQVVQNMCVSIPLARATFETIGDMDRCGAISLRAFRDALTRLGVTLAARDLRMLVVLFDTANGAQILYCALLHMLARVSTASQRVAQTVARCSAFGLSALRDHLTLYIESNDGAMTQQDLHSALSRANNGGSLKFDAAYDASAIFQLMRGSTTTSHHDADADARVSMRDVIARLELCAKHATSAADDCDDTSSSWYNIKTLRRLASNCRKLTCSSHSELVAAFERFDWRSDGVVALDAFVAVAQQQGFYLLTTLQLKQVAKCFGAKRDNRFAINYRQFLDWTAPTAAVDVDEVETKLRAFAHAQAERTTNNKQVAHVLADWRQAFAAADDRKRGFVTRIAFVRVATRELTLPLRDDELRVLLYSYDRMLDDNVDFAAFVQLNWTATSRAATATKQVRFEPLADAAAVAAVVLSLQTTFKASGMALLESFAEAAAGSDNNDKERSCWVDEQQFARALQQLGVLLPSPDVHAVFAAFGALPDRNKLDYRVFVGTTLALDVTSKRVPQRTLSASDDARLVRALTTALQQTRTAMLAALQVLQEHCVVHRFGDVAPAAAWKLLDASGVASLLPRRAIALLVDKFRVRNCNASAEMEQELVSLKSVYAYLKEAATQHLPQQSPKAKATKSTKAQHVTTPAATDALQLQLQDASNDENEALVAFRQLLMSCSDAGVDVRSEFEKLDTHYTGCVTAMQLKQVVLGLGLGRFTTQSPEPLVGQLVRQFRVADAHDAVSYHALLHYMLQPRHAQREPDWFVATSEHLRTRIRLKAGLAGPLDASCSVLCKRLDACFRHFDRAHTNFVMLAALHDGLAALQYALTPSQVQDFVTRIGVYRTGACTLSRMEFDAFVLEPYAAYTLAQLAYELSCHSSSSSSAHDASTAVPRIAQLSRALQLRDSSASNSNGALPAPLFFASVETVLARQLSQRLQRTLACLFDVNRDAHIAYRLFLKVIAQWQTDGVAVPPVHVQPVGVAESPTRHSARTALLRSLYHQLSTLDFDAQVEILNEHMQLQDPTHSGRLRWRQLHSVLEHVGIALSRSAEQQLPRLFAATSDRDDSDDDDEDDGADDPVVRYDKLLMALKELHDDTSDSDDGGKRDDD